MPNLRCSILACLQIVEHIAIRHTKNSKTSYKCPICSALTKGNEIAYASVIKSFPNNSNFDFRKILLQKLQMISLLSVNVPHFLDVSDFLVRRMTDMFSSLLNARMLDARTDMFIMLSIHYFFLDKILFWSLNLLKVCFLSLNFKKFFFHS